MNFRGGLFVFLVVASCTSSVDQLAASKNAITKTVEFNENYQVIYQRVRSMGLKCNDGNISPTASADIDAELFSDLGYAEVTYRINSMGMNNYYWSTKMEKITSASSRLTIISANTINNNIAIQRTLTWANGSQNCSG